MLPKNSNSKAYQERKAEKKRLAQTQKSCAWDEMDKLRALEENARAAKEEAERLAVIAARKAGAVTLEEQEKVKQAFMEKNRRTTSSLAYARTVSVHHANQLPWNLCSKSASSVSNVEKITGNKRFEKFKAVEKTKRWSSSSLIDC